MTIVVRLPDSWGSSPDRLKSSADRLMDDMEFAIVVPPVNGSETQMSSAIDHAHRGDKRKSTEAVESIFEVFDGLAKTVGGRELQAYVGKRCHETLNLLNLNHTPPPIDIKNHRILNPILHGFVGELSAAIAHRILAENGLSAGLVYPSDADFPLVTKGYEMNAEPDLAASRDRSQKILHPRLVLPGNVGVSIGKTGISINRLGSGGPDEAAFALAYAFPNTEEVWIYTDQDGIKTALVPDARTVPQIDRREARHTSILTNKLEPLDALFKERETGPRIYIANFMNPEGPKTEIVEETEDKPPVRFIHYKGHVDIYYIDAPEKVRNQLLNELSGNGVSYFVWGEGSDLILGLHEKGREIGTRIMGKYVDKRSVSLTRELKEKALLGLTSPAITYESGIIGRAGSALKKSGINVLDNYPGLVSLRLAVDREQRHLGIETLYGEFRDVLEHAYAI